MSQPFFKVTKDFTKGFADAINALKHKDVLIGIPASTAGRSDEGEISNAQLLAINEFGSPVNNIPPREPVHTGMWDSRPQVTEQFRQAAKEVLSKGQSAFEKYLERAGIIASNQIKLTINNQVDMAPPAASTLAARKAAGFKVRKL